MGWLLLGVGDQQIHIGAVQIVVHYQVRLVIYLLLQIHIMIALLVETCLGLLALYHSLLILHTAALLEDL